MKNKITFLSLIFLGIVFTQCAKEGVEIESNYYSEEDYALISEHLNLPNTSLDYTLNFPNYYGRPGNQFDSDLATLGRVLFYDVNLSKDRSVSCASCHKQELAFADDVPFSKGIENRETSRNSLALGSVFNFREYYGPSRVPFFWDNRVETVEEQSEQTLANENEMGMEMHTVVARVKEFSYYGPLFKQAFGSAEVNSEKVLAAVSEFVNTIGSYNSLYDQALDDLYAEKGFSYTQYLEQDLAKLNAQENAGKNIYLSNCASCHGNINGLPGQVAANNGLDMDYLDKGIGDLNNDASQIGMFKVPTLRNIELTGPYMHDGRFATLEEVVEHYSNGIQDHPNLNNELKVYSYDTYDYEPVKMNFSNTDKENLLAFLRTFTDEGMLSKQIYADPFK